MKQKVNMLVKYRNLTNNRLVWKRFLGQIYGYLPRNKNRRIILSYHSVESGPLSLPVEKFQAQINWLQEHAAVEPIDTLLAQPGKSGLRVALTFDDGYRSLYTIVAPILLSERYERLFGDLAVLFIIRFSKRWVRNSSVSKYRTELSQTNRQLIMKISNRNHIK